MAAKKFGLKLNANEVGAMLKLNPINRLRPIELGVNKSAQEAFNTATKNAKNTIRNLQDNTKVWVLVKQKIDLMIYSIF